MDQSVTKEDVVTAQPGHTGVRWGWLQSRVKTLEGQRCRFTGESRWTRRKLVCLQRNVESIQKSEDFGHHAEQ